MQAAPPTISPITSANGSSPRPTDSKPKTIAARPIPVRKKPMRSSGGTSVSRMSSMNSVTITMPSMQIGTLMKKIQRQVL